MPEEVGCVGRKDEENMETISQEILQVTEEHCAQRPNNIGMKTLSALLNRTIKLEAHTDGVYNHSKDFSTRIGSWARTLSQCEHSGLAASSDRNEDVASGVKSVGVMKMVYNTDCNSVAVLTSDSYTGSASVDSLDSLVCDQRSSRVSQSQTGCTAQHDSQSQTGGTTQDDVAPHETCSSSEKSTRLCALNTHDQKMETETVPCHVDACGEEVADTELMKQEMRHMGDQPYVCNICYVGFSQISDLEEHSCLNAGEKSYMCIICGLRVTRLESLKIHTRIHTGIKPYKCDVCGKGFTQSSDLSKHYRIHTGDKPYKCHVCPAGFAWFKDLKRHSKIHTGEKPYKCDICGVMFTWVESLKRHIRIHTGDKPYKCDVCGVAFNRNGDLKKHYRIHLGDKPYACDICESTFRQSEHLDRHRRTHTGEKPYKCEICGVKFAWSESLKRHTRIHTGEKPYKCDVCGASFAWTESVKKHKRIHTANPPYKLGAYDAKFRQRNQLQAQESLPARDAKVFRCDDCGAGFAQKCRLKRHMKVHTRD